jgi:hypothetical protein
MTESADAETTRYRVKMYTIRVVTSYLTSVAFVAIGAIVIIHAPSEREVSASIIALASLAVGIGIAGFTGFTFRGRAASLRATGRSGPN